MKAKKRKGVSTTLTTFMGLLLFYADFSFAMEAHYGQEKLSYQEALHIKQMINTVSWEEVYQYTDGKGISRSTVAFINQHRFRSVPATQEMPQNYKAGEQYSVGFNTPSQEDRQLLKTDGNTSHLSNLNDTTLTGDGASVFNQKDGFGDLTNQVNTNAINAREQWQINPNDPTIKASMEVENNALQGTDLSEINTSTQIKSIREETCEEGVTFEVDILRQLVYEPKIVHEDYWTPFSWKVKNFPYNEMWTIDLKNRPGRYYGWCQSVPKMCTSTYVGHMVDTPNQQPYLRHKLADYFKLTPDHFGQIKTQNQGGWIKCYGRGSKDYMYANYRFDYQLRDRKKRTYDAGGREYWQSITPQNEGLVDAHECHEVKRICLDKGNKKFDTITVSRPCWKEKITYQCKSQPIDGCQAFKGKCTLKSSTCLDQTIAPCLKWKRAYTCQTTTNLSTKGLQGDNELFCLDGNCFTPKTEQNKDMNKAIAYLALFQAMQKDMDKLNPPKVFKGEVNHCSKHMINFTNCCTSMDGWGVGIGLSSCSAEEKNLAGRKKKGLCHYVGTYCAEKMPLTGICLRKKSTYCCFQSKISRVFHEQGRSQIGKSWGDAKNPRCDAFTVDELTQLDFSKMDLTELFSDVLANVEKTAFKKVPHQMKDQMPTLQKTVQTKQPNRTYASQYDKALHVKHLINTVSWEEVYQYADNNGISRETVAYIRLHRFSDLPFDQYMKGRIL